jgi:hypothetical protein
LLDEAAFRTLLCWRVLTGQLPQRIEHRSWKPERESPVIINVYDWVSYTLIFSILVWPPADVAAETLEKAQYYKLLRAEDVMAAITRGAGQSWSNEMEFALRERRRVAMGSAKSSVGDSGEPRPRLRVPFHRSRGRG